MDNGEMNQNPQEQVGPVSQTVVYQSNGFALSGLILGIISIFFFWIGILPILAIVFSSIGLHKVRDRGGRGKVKAWIGLILGIVYTLAYLNAYGHLG